MGPFDHATNHRGDRLVPLVEEWRECRGIAVDA
jgi:hypothetical protein